MMSDLRVMASVCLIIKTWEPLKALGNMPYNNYDRSLKMNCKIVPCISHFIFDMLEFLSTKEKHATHAL